MYLFIFNDAFKFFNKYLVNTPKVCPHVRLECSFLRSFGVI